MIIGIDPTVDFAFKQMLGNPKHSNVTIHFLNSILGAPKITHVEFRNPILDKQTDEDKLSVLDILATDQLGRLLNIEVQTSLPAAMTQRLVYYASSLFVGQLTEGDSYSILRPAVSICVLNGALFPQSPKLHLDFRLREPDGLLLSDDIQVHLLELPKLKVTEQNVYHVPLVERWAYFLKNVERLSREDVARLFPDSEFAEAAGILEMIAQTPEQKDFYESRLKFQRDEAARLELARTEGQLKGRIEGILIGEIRSIQRELGIVESSIEELAVMDEAQLVQQVEQLRLLRQGR